MITYRLAFILLSPFILLHLSWKSLRIKSSRYFIQRLGFGIKTPAHDPIWFHCASVGEANTVLPLIHDLHRHDSTLQFIVTTNTITSAGIIKKQNKSYIQHVYLPIDWVCATKRFIKKIKPLALFIVETELWPNLIHQTNKANVKTHIINARLSSKTTEANQWIASIYRKTLKNINHIYARSEDDQSNYIRLGADARKTSVTGNLKYALSSHKTAKQDLTKRSYILAASTHDDEEIQIAKCWLGLDRKELLVIAPRHPERKNKIIEKLNVLTGDIVARTDNNEIKEDTKIFILDTVGELVSWFASAQVVLMGGSFVNSGGHNIIEPAQQGKAILYGPHMDNFQFESQLLLDNKAALQMASMDELSATLPLMLDNEATRSQLETAALNAVKPFEKILSSYTTIVLNNIKQED